MQAARDRAGVCRTEQDVLHLLRGQDIAHSVEALALALPDKEFPLSALEASVKALGGVSSSTCTGPAPTLHAQKLALAARIAPPRARAARCGRQ